MRVDFLTNVETAFLKVFTADSVLKEYNWERWDSDQTVELPRATLGLSARRDPEDTPYHRIEAVIRFEGRPKKQKMTAIVNQLKDVLETINTADLDTASGNTVQFMGHAITVNENRSIVEGLRVWMFAFVIYGLPMV